MKNWRMWVGGLLLMLAGAFLALAIEHALILHQRGTHTAGHAKPSTEVILTTLSEVLDLTPAQHDSIQRVMKKHQTDIDSVWRSIHRELRVNMDTVHMEIGRVLTAEQTEKFHDWLRGQH